MGEESPSIIDGALLSSQLNTTWKKKNKKINKT